MYRMQLLRRRQALMQKGSELHLEQFNTRSHLLILESVVLNGGSGQFRLFRGRDDFPVLVHLVDVGDYNRQAHGEKHRRDDRCGACCHAHRLDDGMR